MNKLIQRIVTTQLQFEQWLRKRPLLRSYFEHRHHLQASQHQFGNLYVHEIMLADQARVATFRQAINKYVNQTTTVLDLGTGTGLLAFLSALRQARQIYAIDHAEIIEVAKAVAEINQLANIHFVKASSQQVTLPEKVDVIVQEQIGSWLFNENMIGSVLDLRDRLLKPGGKILPGCFELFVEPVQLKDESRVPFLWEQRIAGLDFTPLQVIGEAAAADYFYSDIRPAEVDFLLCQPAPLLRFDLATVRANELTMPLHYRQTVTEPGRLDGFCLYFRAIFDEEISFSTSPLASNRPYHWTNLFYRVAAKEYKVGEVIEFTLQMNNLLDRRSWHWQMQPATPIVINVINSSPSHFAGQPQTAAAFVG